MPKGALLKDYYSALLTNMVVFEHNVLTNGRVCQLCVRAVKEKPPGLASSAAEPLSDAAAVPAKSFAIAARSVLGHIQSFHVHVNNRYYGRGLSVFDLDVHRDPSRLPTLLIEQYARQPPTECAGTDSISNQCYSSRRGGAFHQCDSSEEYNLDASLPALDSLYCRAIRAEKESGGGFGMDNAVIKLFQEKLARRGLGAGAGATEDCHPVVDLLIPRQPLMRLLDTPSQEEERIPRHLVVLEHGFCGHPGDMMLLRSVLSLEFPKHTRFLSAACNAGEAKSSESIDVMGRRLALEVLAYARTNMPDLLFTHGTEPRISFIGHSAGGLIIRRCLQEVSMAPLLDKLHVFMSLASPHLGTLFAESQLVATGMWAMLKLKKAQTLKVGVDLLFSCVILAC